MVERSLSAILNPKTSSSTLGCSLSLDERTRQDGARVKFLRVISAIMNVQRTLREVLAINCIVTRTQVSIFEVNKSDLDLSPILIVVPSFVRLWSVMQWMYTRWFVRARTIMSEFIYYWEYFFSLFMIITEKFDIRKI